ncbi:MAG: response regulator [Candidatus Dormiibacterota bacterium]
MTEGRAPRLLVIEDHRYLGGLLRDVLPQAGFQVELVGGTERLVPTLDDFCPDVILSDFRLRDEDGLDVCLMVRGSPRHREVPVVLHTAVDPVNRRLQEALSLPRVSLLRKPADYQSMVTLLRELAAEGPTGGPGTL